MIRSGAAHARQTQPAQKDTAVYNLPPIIVTPTTAVERESPVTFSNLGAAEIKERYTSQDLPAVLSELPSSVHYSLNGNDIGYTFLNLRGFDQRRLSVMINGVPQNDPEDHEVYWIDIADLPGFTQNIQVQRGAGSAFYGPPAIGGSINITTTPLTAQPRISLSSGFGFQELGDENRIDLSTRKNSIAISSGLLNNHYALYGSLARITSDGYRQQSWTDLGSYFIGAARFDESMTTRVNVYGGPVGDGEAYYGLPKYYNEDKQLRRSNYSYWGFDSTGNRVDRASIVMQKPQAVESFSQPHYEIIHDWTVSPAVSVHNTIFYIQGDGYFDYDGDWIPYDLVAPGWFRQYVGYDSTFGVSQFPAFVVRGFVGNKQGGWLPRVEWDHGSGTLTLGGELRIHRSVHWGKIVSASVLPSASFDPDFHFYEYNGEKDMASIYGHEMYHIDDRTTVMTDLQFAHDRYGVHNEKFLHNDFDISYDFLNPHIGINRNFSDRLNGYVSLSYTSREPRLRNLYPAEDAWFGGMPLFESRTLLDGGGNPIIRYQYDKPFASPEHLFDIELGGGYAFEKGKLSANVYWMDFHDELVKSGTIDIFGESILLNANRTRHIGIEVDGKYDLMHSLYLSGNATFSDNKIIEHRFYDANESIDRVLDDNPIAGFPDVVANARLRYGNADCSLSLLVKYVGSFHTDNLNDDRNTVDAFTVSDIDATWKLPSIVENTDISVMGRVGNVFNRLYLASGEGIAFFPAAERNYYIGLSINL